MLPSTWSVELQKHSRRLKANVIIELLGQDVQKRTSKKEAMQPAPSTRISDDNRVEEKRPMIVTLEAWAARTFDPPPSIRTLRAWAKSGLISPAAVKVGTRYMVHEHAEYRPLPIEGDLSRLSERARKIVYMSTKTP